MTFARPLPTALYGAGTGVSKTDKTKHVQPLPSGGSDPGTVRMHNGHQHGTPSGRGPSAPPDWQAGWPCPQHVVTFVHGAPSEGGAAVGTPGNEPPPVRARGGWQLRQSSHETFLLQRISGVRAAGGAVRCWRPPALMHKFDRPGWLRSTRRTVVPSHRSPQGLRNRARRSDGPWQKLTPKA